MSVEKAYSLTSRVSKSKQKRRVVLSMTDEIQKASSKLSKSTTLLVLNRMYQIGKIEERSAKRREKVRRLKRLVDRQFVRVPSSIRNAFGRVINQLNLIKRRSIENNKNPRNSPTVSNTLSLSTSQVFNTSIQSASQKEDRCITKQLSKQLK